MIPDVSDRGARKSAVPAAPRETGEFQSVVPGSQGRTEPGLAWADDLPFPVSLRSHKTQDDEGCRAGSRLGPGSDILGRCGPLLRGVQVGSPRLAGVACTVRRKWSRRPASFQLASWRQLRASRAFWGAPLFLGTAVTHLAKSPPLTVRRICPRTAMVHKRKPR